MAYIKPKWEGSGRLQGMGNEINFIDSSFKRRQVVGAGKNEKGQTLHKLHHLELDFVEKTESGFLSTNLDMGALL